MKDVPRGALPDTLRSWVDERAATGDEDPSAVLSRAVTLYRLVEKHVDTTGERTDDGVVQLDRLVERAAALEELDDQLDQLSTVDDRLTAVEDDVDEKIADVRERVIQVKREGDTDRDALRERLDGVEATVDDGFGNFESILSGLADEVETLDEKLTRLAAVVVALRRRTAATERRLAQLSRLEAATDLKRAANRHGETKAKCEDCSGTVALGLLTEPRCPHCESTFADIEPSRRPFSAATLTTGAPPALTSGEADAGDEPETLENAAADLLEESSRV
jgi:chromosome segregation ATPase